MKGYGVEGRKPNTDFEARSCRLFSLDYLAKEPRAILEAASIFAAASMRTQKFVSKITVAMFDIDESEAQIPGHLRGVVKIFDDGFNLAIRQNWIVF